MRGKKTKVLMIRRKRKMVWWFRDMIPTERSSYLTDIRYGGRTNLMEIADSVANIIVCNGYREYHNQLSGTRGIPIEAIYLNKISLSRDCIEVGNTRIMILGSRIIVGCF